MIGFESVPNFPSIQPSFDMHLIVSCCHDKRLRFLFYLPTLQFGCNPVVVFFLLIFCQNNRFRISQKCSSPNISFKNILNLFFIIIPVQTLLNVSRACVGSFDCANPGDWAYTPFPNNIVNCLCCFSRVFTQSRPP